MFPQGKPESSGNILRNRQLPVWTVAFASLVTLAILAGCGGGPTGSTTPPPQPTQTPTITSFSPTSGAIGTSLTITGTNLSGATSVAIGGVPATTFSVVSATSVHATVPAGAVTGKISIVTPQGSATSASNFTVSASAPTITSFSPASGQVGVGVTLTGTNFTGATSVKFNGTSATFTVTDSSHISTSVPSGATSGTISVVTAGGTATSASSFTVTTSSSGLDLTIDGLYITQSTQNYPVHDVPLIAGRSAWVRVFVLANQTNTATPQVKVNFVNGGTTHTLTINPPGSSVPTSVDTSNANASWNMAVPSAWITAGTTVSADVDPTNQVAESNKSNNHFSYGALTMASVHQWKVTLVPIHTTDGRTGTVENGSRTKNDLVQPARGLYPVPDNVDVVVAPTFNASTTGANPLLTSTDSNNNWENVLSELLAKRAADNVTDRTYYGFVNVSYTSGVAGLGYIGAGAAIGWDYNGAQWVLAHETGHNFGRKHSPCGGALGVDTAYPYTGGLIGVPGWDVFVTSGNLKPTTDSDIMGYCSNQWISDYVYKSVVNFRSLPSTSYDIVQGAAVASGATAKPGLLVWGRMEGGRMVLEPAFRVTTTATAVEAGPYTWEAKDAQGRTVKSVLFQMYEIADVPNQEPQHFAFVVPMDDATMTAVETVRILKGANELATQKAKTSLQTEQAMGIFRVSDLGGRRAEVHWDAQAHPVLMLRDAKTGEVRGFLRGGDATVEDVPDNLEIQLSDGVKSRVMMRNRPSVE